MIILAAPAPAPVDWMELKQHTKTPVLYGPPVPPCPVMVMFPVSDRIVLSSKTPVLNPWLPFPPVPLMVMGPAEDCMVEKNVFTPMLPPMSLFPPVPLMAMAPVPVVLMTDEEAI